MNTLSLYLRYLGISIRSQMQYRVSFVVRALAHFVICSGEFLGLAALFQRFGRIDGWSLGEVGLFHGMIAIAFAIAEGVVRGFDVMGRLVRSGDFDRMLLRPRGTAFQVLAQELQLTHVGRFAQGLLVLLWSARALRLAWTAPRIALLLFAIAGGACLFSGLFVLQGTLCFWTIESLEIVNCATYGGVGAGQFPLTIYRPWFRHIFTFLIPLATINYFPAHAILGRVDSLGSTPLMQWLSPLAGLAFLLASLRVWRFGVRRYTSTES